MAHQTKDPTPIRELAPDAPEGLCKVVSKLMAKAPEDRFTGCDEVVEALEPFLGELTAGPKPGSGRVPASGLRRPGAPGSRPGSSGPRPGLPNPPASNYGGRPAPASAPARTPPPPQSHPGVKINPMPPGRGDVGRPAAGSNPGVSRNGPPPSGDRRLPGRGSFQLPQAEPVAEAVEEAAPPQLRAENLRWADEANEPRGNVGPFGLVMVALLVMVAVYFGATFLMNK
jgi:hypothetical protein